MAKNKKIHLNLTDDQHFQLKLTCVSNRSTIQATCEKIIMEYLEKIKKPGISPEAWAKGISPSGQN